MVMHSNRQNALSVRLTDNIILKDIMDFLRGRNTLGRFKHGRFVLFTDNIHAEFNTFITNEYGWTSNQLANFMLAFAAERTVKSAFAIACSTNFAQV